MPKLLEMEMIHFIEGLPVASGEFHLPEGLILAQERMLRAGVVDSCA